MLIKDRLDVVIIPERLYRIQYLHTPGLRISPWVVQGATSYIGVSRKSSLMNYLPELLQALEEIRHDGTYDQIQQKYASYSVDDLESKR